MPTDTPRPEIATPLAMPLRLMLRVSTRGGYGLADESGRVVCSTPPKADNARSLADLTAIRDLANAAARLAELTPEDVVAHITGFPVDEIADGPALSDVAEVLAAVRALVGAERAKS